MRNWKDFHEIPITQDAQAHCTNYTESSERVQPDLMVTLGHSQARRKSTPPPLAARSAHSAVSLSIAPFPKNLCAAPPVAKKKEMWRLLFINSFADFLSN